MSLAGESGEAQASARRPSAIARRLIAARMVLAATFAAERDRWFLWLPAAFGAGVALYLGLGFEPPLASAPVLAALAFVAARKAKAQLAARPALALALGLAAALAAGFFWVQLRAHLVARAPVVTRGAHGIEGPIAMIEPRRDGARLTIDPARLERRDVITHAARVRFTVKGPLDPALAVGAVIRVDGMLAPPSGPFTPGGHDFRLRAFFQGLGGIGWAFGAPEILERAPSAGPMASIQTARLHIATTASAVTPGDPGAVAAALLTGHRGAISDEAWRAMQSAGLAHLLAISGLHVGLVAGALFFAARAALALAPSLTLRIPAQKIAAAATLAGTLGYVFLAGFTTPTQRAFLMAATVLIAIIVERRAISMRLVAIAAAVVLAIDPSAVASASFQMSFAAVIGLIAAYEALRAHEIAPNQEGPPPLWKSAGRYVGGVALTTVIASIATGPFAAFHFQRISLIGSFSNLIAVPLTAFWIMPMGLLGLALEPFALSEPAYWAMAAGVAQVLLVAQIAADAPHAAASTPQWPPAALGAIVLGGLWLCLWRRAWRYAGLAPIALGIALGAAARPYDLFVDKDASLVAVNDPGFGLAASDWAKDGFVERQWRRAAGGPAEAEWPGEWRSLAGAGALRCDPYGCVYQIDGRAVAFTRHAAALEDDCARADLVIALYGRARCESGEARAIDRGALIAGGGLAVSFAPEGLAVIEADPEGGARLWTRH